MHLRTDERYQLGGNQVAIADVIIRLFMNKMGQCGPSMSLCNNLDTDDIEEQFLENEKLKRETGFTRWYDHMSYFQYCGVVSQRGVASCGPPLPIRL